jgi:hypothetical protein
MPPRTALAQPLKALAQQPPGGRRSQRCQRGLGDLAPGQVGPAGRDLTGAAVRQPARKLDLPPLGSPSEYLQLDVAQLAGSLE